MIELLNAALTPLIAIIVAYIAYQQYRVNRLRLSLDLFERRLNVFEAVQDFLSAIVKAGKVDTARAVSFRSQASQAAFLFGEDITGYLDTLYKKALALMRVGDELYPQDGSPGLPRGPEREEAAKKKTELLKWLGDQLTESEKIFKQYIGVLRRFR